MLDYPTAKELAQHVADAEAKDLSSHESYVIVDDRAYEHPWGWVFEPAMEPYHTTGEPCLRGGAWCLSVDRFTGKIQLSSWAGWKAEQWPIIELHLSDADHDSNDVYHFLRLYKGWTATETRKALSELPRVIAVGPTTSISPVARALTERGANVELRQRHE